MRKLFLFLLACSLTAYSQGVGGKGGFGGKAGIGGGASAGGSAPTPTANNCNGNTGSFSANCAMGTVTTGNYILVPFFAAGTDTVTGVTDSHSNSYTAVGVTCSAGGSQSVYLYRAKNITGGANTVTVTTTGSNGSIDMEAIEISGASTSSPEDGTAVCGTGNSTAPSATSGSPAGNDLIVSYVRINSATTLTVPSGYTLLQEGAGNSEGSAYKQPVSTAQTATWASTGSGQWATEVILLH